MITLGFDTSGAHSSAALHRDGDILASRHEEMTKGQAERLFPLLEEVLKEAGLSWQDLDRIGVGTGPGNFTGIRIAVSAARGLSLSLNIPAIGVSILDAVAHGTDGPVLACLSAPAGNAYLQLHGRGRVPDQAARLVKPGDPLSEFSDQSPLCIGTAAPQIAYRVGGTVEPPRFSPASAVAQLAALADPSQAPSPAPLYMRPADAAPSRDTPPVIVP